MLSSSGLCGLCPEVVFHASGYIYVGDLQNHRIQKFSAGAVTPVKASTWGRLKVLYR